MKQKHFLITIFLLPLFLLSTGAYSEEPVSKKKTVEVEKGCICKNKKRK